MSFQPTGPILNPDNTFLPTKHRGQPLKIRPSKLAANSLKSTLPLTAENDMTLDLNYIFNWPLLVYTKRWWEFHTGLVAMWYSNFENFSKWRMRPKQHASLNLSLFIVNQSHHKQEEDEKWNSKFFRYIYPWCLISFHWKKIKDWFKASEAIREATGEGPDETYPEEGPSSGIFVFNVSKSNLELLKTSRKCVSSKRIGDNSLQSMSSMYIILPLIFCSTSYFTSWSQLIIL